MSVKGRRAKRTLDAQSTALRFHQRQAVVSGWGMDPCPEPETQAVLNLGLSEQSSQRPGIVTRQGGDSNKVNDSVSVANRARKGPQQIQQFALGFEEVLSHDLPFHYMALRHLLNFCEGVNLEPHKQRQRNDHEYMRITHVLMSEYLDELDGMAAPW